MDKPAISLRLRFFYASATQHYASLAYTNCFEGAAARKHL